MSFAALRIDVRRDTSVGSTSVKYLPPPRRNNYRSIFEIRSLIALDNSYIPIGNIDKNRETEMLKLKNFSCS